MSSEYIENILVSYHQARSNHRISVERFGPDSRSAKLHDRVSQQYRKALELKGVTDFTNYRDDWTNR